MPPLQQIRMRPDTRMAALGQGVSDAGAIMGQGLMNYGLHKQDQADQARQTQALQAKAQEEQLRYEEKQAQLDQQFLLDLEGYGDELPNEFLHKIGELRFGERWQAEYAPSMESAWSRRKEKKNAETFKGVEERGIKLARSWITRALGIADSQDDNEDKKKSLSELQDRWESQRREIAFSLAGGNEEWLLPLYRRMDEEAAAHGFLNPGKVGQRIATDDEYITRIESDRIEYQKNRQPPPNTVVGAALTAPPPPNAIAAAVGGRPGPSQPPAGTITHPDGHMSAPRSLTAPPGGAPAVNETGYMPFNLASQQAIGRMGLARSHPGGMAEAAGGTTASAAGGVVPPEHAEWYKHVTGTAVTPKGTPTMEDKIQEQLARGITWEQIRDALAKRGFFNNMTSKQR